jgi:hypothetical protein
MTIKAYDGTTWQTQKSLKLYNGAQWLTAKQAWIFNGANWAINYPEFPVNTAGPSISALSGIAGRIGCVYIASVGSWNSNDAYNPTSYSYQWQRAGSDISGATNNTYTTGANDVEQIISCRVTANNLRGSTPASATTGLQMLTQVTSISVSDYTSTPNKPSSVSIGNTGLSYSGSFTTLDNISTYYEALGGGTAGTPSVNSAAKTFTGTGTAGNASVSIRGVNTSKQLYINWPVAVGAISYDIYVNGNYFTNVSPGTNNNYIYTAPDENARNFSVYPRSTSIQGYGSSTSTPVAATTKYSAYESSATISLANPVPVNTSAPTLSPTGGYTAGQTLTYGVGSWSNSPTSYDLRLYRGTSNVNTGETFVASSTSSSATYTIPASDYDGTGRYYYRAFATATNAGGTSNGGAFVSGTEGGPLAQPVVIPSGGTVSISTDTGNYNTGSIITYSTSGWANSPSSSGYSLRLHNGTSPVLTSDPQRGSTTSSSATYTITSSDVGKYFKAWATASNTAGTSSDASSSQVGPATTPPVTAPGVPSVSNHYDGYISSYYTWTLTIDQGSGGTPASYDWELQLGSNGSTSLASASGSVTGSGTKTVTRNSSTYSYARWRSRAVNTNSTSAWSSYTVWQ